jgi:uncharacterized protein (TIGR02284 family)
MQTQGSTTQSIDQLNSFLRGELSAVETYRQAISKLPHSAHRALFEQCARSHEDRADLLMREVRRLGGTPAEDSGTWGTFAKIVEGGAQLFGEKAAIAALEEGEDHGKNDYQRDLPELDAPLRELIANQVLPEQLRTHNVMSALKRTAA